MILRHVSSSLFRCWSRPLSPTLLVLALLSGSGAALSVQAATAEERDQHFQAITAVLDRGFGLTGERQRAAFAALSYPDDAWFRKALDWYAAKRAKNGVLEPARIAALDKIIGDLRAELTVAEEAGKLPEPVARLVAGSGSQVTSLVNDLAKFLDPDEPEPQVMRVAERTAIAQGQVAALIAAVDQEWRRTMLKVTGNAAAEKAGYELPENDPKALAATRSATMLRYEAIKPVFLAYSALREVITRGRQFGLDPAVVSAANSWIQAFLKENAAMLSEWEYSYADNFPPLKAYLNTVLLECVRQQVGTLKVDDLEGSLQGVTSNDLKQVKDPSVREEFIHLQIRCWTAMMRTRLELALFEADKAKSAKQVKKGLELFAQFKDGYKTAKDMTPNSSDLTRSSLLGMLWITAARLHLAKGDSSAATGLLSEVAKNKKIFAADLARRWLLKINSNPSGSNDWGKPTSPVEPIQAVSIAQALLNEAKASTDEKVKRAQWLAAATQLRGGVLGVNTAYADEFVENGPELFNLYASCLANLQLRYQAALIAEEGLRAISTRITKESNPWKKGGSWTESGKKIVRLASNAMLLASALTNRAKGTAAAAVQSEVIELVQRIAPELAGQNAEEILITNALGDGDWEIALQKAREFLKKYPTQQPKVYSWVISAYSGWYDQAKKNKDEAKAKQISAEMQTATSAMEQEAKAELAKKPDAERTRDWMRVLATVQAAKLSSLMANDQFVDVLTIYGPDFWKNPPADDALRARLLRGLCLAVNGAEAQRIKDDKAKADPQSLINAWKLYEKAYATYRRFLPSIKDPVENNKVLRFGKTMAGGMSTVAFLAEALGTQKDAPAELADILRLSRRAFADLMEPALTAVDKPNTIQVVADTLWSIDEHERAVRLYELFQGAIEADKDLQGFLATPKTALDGIQELLGTRPELTSDWAKVRDLIEDKPGLEDLIKQGESPDKYGEKKRNFSDALVALRAFRIKAEGLKTKLGPDAWAKGEAAIKGLDRLLVSAVQKVSIKAKLAQGYRETGHADKARELFSELYAYESENPAYAAAYVDIVLDQVRVDPLSAKKDDIEKARDIARTIRNDSGNNLDLYWQASVQVMELSLALGDAKSVNEALKFNAVNQSGPTASLIQAPVPADERQTGDDKRALRARNALAVELANRYLALFKGNGVTVAIPQRLDQVTAPDGKVWTLFVPIDAPKFEAQAVTNQDDAEVTVFVAQGTSAVIAGKPGATSEPAPATEPKVAEPKEAEPKADGDKPEPKAVPKAAPKADVPKTGAKPAPKAAPKPAPKPVTGTKPAPVPPAEKKP